TQAARDRRGTCCARGHRQSADHAYEPTHTREGNERPSRPRRSVRALVARVANSLCSPTMAVGDAMSVRVVSVKPKASVQEAIARMLEEGIGAVAVCDGPRLVGIFTERDVLRCAGEGSMFGEVAVENVMTPRPFTASPGDDLLEAAELMAAKRIRHLPVCE